MEGKEFISYIDSEIDNLREDLHQPGWTSWALMGTVAALVWLLLDLLQNGNSYSFKTLGSLLLIISFLDYSYFYLTRLVQAPLPSDSPKGRLMPHYLPRTLQLPMLLTIGQFIFLIWVINQYASDMGSLITNLSLACASLVLFTASAAFVVSLSTLPLPSGRPRATKIVPLVTLLLMLPPTGYHIRFLFFSPGATPFSELRLAFVVAAMFFVLFKLATTPPSRITLQVLQGIRREFAMARIDIETARRQTDITISGMRASDYLQGRVSTFLSQAHDVSDELSKSLSALTSLEDLQSQIGQSQPSADQTTRRRELLREIARSTGKTKSLLESLGHSNLPLQRRVNLLKRLSFLFPSEDLPQLVQKIEDARTNLRKQSDDLHARYSKIYEMLKDQLQ
jgi:hypothetical protein